MTTAELVTALITIGLAVYSVTALRRRRTWRARGWYVAGLLLGAVMGGIVVGWPLGVVVGLASVSVAPDTYRAARRAIADWRARREQ